MVADLCIASLLWREHWRFPFGNCHPQLCEAVMGIMISAGMPKCGYGLQANRQLVLSWWRGSRMHSHWVTRRDRWAVWPDVWLQLVGWPVWELNYLMWKMKPHWIYSCVFVTSSYSSHAEVGVYKQQGLKRWNYAWVSCCDWWKNTWKDCFVSAGNIWRTFGMKIVKVGSGRLPHLSMRNKNESLEKGVVVMLAVLEGLLLQIFNHLKAFSTQRQTVTSVCQSIAAIVLDNKWTTVCSCALSCGKDVSPWNRWS